MYDAPVKSFGAILLPLLCVLCTLSCETERRPPPKHETAPDAPLVPWKAPEKVVHLTEATRDDRALALSDSRRFPECWDLFELDGKPREKFPLPERVERALALTSCEVEGSFVLDDGTRVYAWGAQEQPGSRARDLQAAAWNADGSLRWSATMDRSRNAANWVANYRKSFAFAIPPRHACFGTLWEGETQGQCVNLETGEKRWDGSLPFWAGIEPQPGSDGYYVADLSALTKRYPFTGAEMRHVGLTGLGGRAGYYSTDGRRLYFAPSRTETPELIAYDFETLAPVWRTPLPESPQAALSVAFDNLDLTLLKLGETLYAVDTETGTVRWAYGIGDDVPSFAAHGGKLYILYRQPDEPNMLVALEPKDGKVLWKAPTPAGTLRIASIEGVLVLGSVRAVQHVKNLVLDEKKGG